MLGKTGWVVPTENPFKLSKAIEKALSKLVKVSGIKDALKQD